MKFSSRPFENETDLQRMCALLVDARRIAGHDAGYWHVGDLAWRYFLLTFRADPCRSIRLWQDASGKLVGYAVFGDDFSIDWQILLDACWHGIEDEMMVWAKERWSEAMNDPISNPQSPMGFIVRGVAGEHEAANRASAHRESFAPSRVTDDGYLRLMRMAEYDRELDVAAVSPDGVIAAYAMGWVDTVNKIGEFEPVGACPAYQRKGLTRAALLEGMRRMKERGAHTAIVCTGAKNDPALPLYESVGFQRVDRELEYVRKA